MPTTHLNSTRIKHNPDWWPHRSGWKVGFKLCSDNSIRSMTTCYFTPYYAKFTSCFGCWCFVDVCDAFTTIKICSFCVSNIVKSEKTRVLIWISSTSLVSKNSSLYVQSYRLQHKLDENRNVGLQFRKIGEEYYDWNLKGRESEHLRGKRNKSDNEVAQMQRNPFGQKLRRQFTKHTTTP